MEGEVEFGDMLLMSAQRHSFLKADVKPYGEYNI